MQATEEFAIREHATHRRMQELDEKMSILNKKSQLNLDDVVKIKFRFKDSSTFLGLGVPA